ncbi:MAG: hypothetical protein JWQ83_2018 [Lacunisphaera sp.]|nr:hypothetical protein [Lacunisphaera sp.]MDB6166878.1 hypothetical protein [Lacunisphaera sp.]
MNAYFIFLVRKNQVAHLALHLIAGLIAVTFLSGVASGKTKHAPVSSSVLAVSPAFMAASPAGTLAAADQPVRR